VSYWYYVSWRSEALYFNKSKEKSGREIETVKERLGTRRANWARRRDENRVGWEIAGPIGNQIEKKKKKKKRGSFMI
jgi:hypothetical protein